MRNFLHLPEMSVLNIIALVLLAFIGAVMAIVVVLTYYRITETFEPLSPQGALRFANLEGPVKLTPGEKVELERVYCNDAGEELTGILSSTFVEVGTNKQVPGSGLTAVYPPGCNRHVTETTVPRDITPGRWSIVRSILILKGNNFQQVTSQTPQFEVVANNP